MTSAAMLSLGASSTSANWDAIDWQPIEANVRRLQMRIAKATREGRWGKVKALQWLLTHSFSAKFLAVRRVVRNRGRHTAGVDGCLWRTSRQKFQAARSLQRRGYHALPLQQGIGALAIDAFHPRCNRGRRDEEGVGRLFEGPATRGTKFEDRHPLMGAVMRPALRRDLRYADVFDAELFVQQGARFVEPIVLRRESHPRIDAIGGPGTRVYNGVVGQCDRMEYRRLNAVLPALGKMDLRWLRIGEHGGLRKRVLESFR